MLILTPTVMELEKLFGAEISRAVLTQRSAAVGKEDEPLEIALCGMGLAAAGGGAASAMARHRRVYADLPRAPHAILIGIAGAFDAELNPPGSVVIGEEARIAGIGYGRGAAHVAATTQEQAHPYRGLPAASASGPSPAQYGLPLHRPAALNPPAASGVFVSAACSSGTPEQAAEVLRLHPDAIAEDMETYAVALAARLEGFRLTAIRGISNAAGDRNHAGWKIGEALESAQLYLDLTMQAYAKEFRLRPA